MSDLNAHGQAVAKALQSTLEKAFQKIELELTQDSEIGEREVIEYGSMMRVDGMGKFNGPCYIFALKLFKNQEDQEAKLPCGTFVMYFEEEGIEKILKKIGHRGFDDDDDDFILENLGTYAKQLAESFAVSLSSIGYSSIIVSDPIGHKNSIPEGINFPYSVYKYQEVTLHLWSKKAVVGNAIVAPA